MSELSVMPVTCWEEWTAIFHTLFKKQTSLGVYGEDVINKTSYIKGLEYLLAVLKRDKYKNNLSLGYTADFLQHYSSIGEVSLTATKKLSYTEESQIIRQVGLDIVRFSSQMADMCQKKNVKSINNMLGEIGMKEHDYIAEVRHALTHKQLPSLLLVQRSLSYLIGFIYEKYWLDQYSQLVKSDLIDNDLVQKYFKFILGGENAAANTSLTANTTRQVVKRMSNIIADNLQTFRRRLNDISLVFIKNYDGEQDLIQIDNLKKKKLHLAYFLSELLRIALKASFYESHSVQRDEKELIIQKIAKIIIDINGDAEFNKAFQKISQVSFLKYKFNRIDLLTEVYTELRPLKQAIDKIFGLSEAEDKKSKLNGSIVSQSDLNDKETATSSDQQLNATSSIEINKFGSFTLKMDHIPSLLGKKVLQTI
ncbi:hypothetical protein ABPG74_022176 [Tetrahymena malaccensis]